MAEHVDVPPSEVHEVLARHVLTDGMKLVVDLQRSRGSRLVDARNGTRYLDMYTFFASAPLGLNPPGHRRRPDVHGRARRGRGQQAGQPGHVHARRTPSSWRPSSGCSATRRCRTCSSSRAARWRSRTRSRSPSTGRAGSNEAAGRDRRLGTKIMHLTQAFHGRSGYTLSLTNTEPNKTDRFPKFDWPRIDVPAITFPLDDHLDEVVAAEQRALDQARRAFARAPARHRRLHRRADPGRGRRQPHPRRVLPARCWSSCTTTTRCSSSTRCRPASAPPARRGRTSSWACSPTSSPSPRRPSWAASWPAAGSTRCRTTSSPCPGRINSTWGGGLIDMVRSPAAAGDHRGRRADRGGRAQGARGCVAGLRADRAPRPA